MKLKFLNSILKNNEDKEIYPTFIQKRQEDKEIYPTFEKYEYKPSIYESNIETDEPYIETDQEQNQKKCIEIPTIKLHGGIRL